MMVAKYSVIPLVRTRGRDRSEAEEWGREADQGGACRVGLRRLPGQRERPGSPCWSTQVGEKSSSVQGSSPWPLLWLLPWVRPVPFPRALQGQRPSAPASMEQVWAEMIHIYLISWLAEPVLKVHVAEKINSNFQHFFDCGLKSGVYKLIKQIQTVVTFQWIQVVKF